MAPRLTRRLWRLCIRFSPCAVIAYNLAPLIVGFMGGFAGAFLPLLAVEAAAPRLVQHAMVVLANMAAGASAGVAAAAAKRPARVAVMGLDVVRVGDSVRVDVLAVNESSVVARDVTLYTSGFRVEGFEVALATLPEGIVIVGEGGEKCCMCRACRIEGLPEEAYRVKTVARAPGEGVRVRGVHASLMPPRSILEAPVYQVELIDLSACLEELGDCSGLRRCGAPARPRGEVLLAARILSGGETLVALAAPVRDAHETLVELSVEVAGDPVPQVTEEVAVRTAVERLEGGEWLVTVEAAVEGERVERWYNVKPYKCQPPHPPIA